MLSGCEAINWLGWSQKSWTILFLVMNSQIWTTWGWLYRDVCRSELVLSFDKYDNDTEYNCLKLDLIWTVYCYCNKWKRKCKYELNWQYHLLCYITALSEQCLHIVAVVSAICVQWSLVSAFCQKYKPGETFVFTLGPFKWDEFLLWHLAFRWSFLS